MRTVDKTAWEVLNATADDYENLEQIYCMVCLEFCAAEYQRGAFYYRKARGAPLLEEIADRIRTLVEAGLLETAAEGNGLPPHDLKDVSYVWRAWFRMTPQGRTAWESSEYANLVEQQEPT